MAIFGIQIGVWAFIRVWAFHRIFYGILYFCIKLMQYIFFQSPETSLGACKENRKGITMDNKLVD